MSREILDYIFYLVCMKLVNICSVARVAEADIDFLKNHL